MGKNSDTPEPLQLADILVPNAVLRAFDLTVNDETARLFDETKKKQDEVIKLKQVSEQQLSMVVQL